MECGSPPSKGTIATATSWWPRTSLSNCWTSPILSNSLIFRPTNCSVFIFRHHHHHDGIRAKVGTLQTSVVWSISLDHRLQATDQINHIFILIFYCFYKQIKSIQHPHLLLLLHPRQGIKIQNVASTGQVKTRFRISPGDGSCPWRTNSDLEF